MTPAPPVDPLRLSNCPRCGYALEGLAPEGICPECGRGYDQSVIVLHGWGRGSRVDISNARPWVGVLLVIVYSGLILNWGPSYVPFWRNTTGYVCIGIWMLVIALALWKRWTNDLPGLAQVWLSSSGCCQFDDSTRARNPKFSPWSEGREVLVQDLSGGRARLKFDYRTPWWSSKIIPVDAEVRCTTQQTEALRRRIDEWRKCATTSPIPEAATCPPASRVQ